MLGRGPHGKAALCAPLLILALLTGLTGCAGADGGEGGADAAPSSPPDAKGGSSPSPKTKDKPSAGAEPSASSTLPKAADGTDTKACSDGDCEVELSKGDEIQPPSSYGVDKFTVQKIEDHVITWTAGFSGGRVSTSARGAQNSSTSCTNGSCSGNLGKSKGKIEINRLVIEFTSIGDDRAVARISPKK
ncbi:hypothetical protein G4Z16_08690 [Streptomyces bathyalis]|uniref:Lipoprotein n=1 Tax=Streptomyces bathyalis TaxID=2710756 RepID=A0A7T1WRS5_9ACTN|nr:hypothetical protein [Streptomyces bathyalis]QPP06462.1 hypothetical protein G4Z16_08690 [Streptomyces bathyalis]